MEQEKHWDLIIKPKNKWYQLDLVAIWKYRDLLMLMVRRDFVSVYKQTILGPIWFFIQPVITSITFTFIFGGVAKISTDGNPPILFYMAGIYQPWTDKETGETMDTFSIITTKANTMMEQIHNKKKRMPTILNEAQASEWIEPNLSESKIMQLASSAYEAAYMSAYTIHKSFRMSSTPMEQYEFQELAALI